MYIGPHKIDSLIDPYLLIGYVILICTVYIYVGFSATARSEFSQNSRIGGALS